MTYNYQILYCQNDLPDNGELWKKVQYLQGKTSGVIRHYEKFLNFSFFDRVVVISEGYEQAPKTFKDIVQKFSAKTVLIRACDLTQSAIFDLLEVEVEANGTLGAWNFVHNKQLQVKLGESFSFGFEYQKNSLEKILLQLKCTDPAYSVFTVSLFNALSTKCLLHKPLRYANSMTNLVSRAEGFFEISLDNPEINAIGKRYTVTVQYSGASKKQAVADIFWNNFYSPHRFSYTGKELFGSVNFLAF